ncbi:MAG: hypothetical protein MR630_02090 [Selenomonas sp.]|uniref:hypothetical protein n=1 Tax=Selenomonas sp. TaxID=2053611 RepID=UPI0025CE0130|nr:hypothetical protein [Selenomonas sp.]MCI6231403.1 hypothetical protein [Selenomonas sp.]
MKLKKMLSDMFLAAAIVTGSQFASLGSAEAYDAWICSMNRIEYYVITESVNCTNNRWYAQVKIVENGKLKRIAQYRFVPIDGDISVSFIWYGGWEFMGLKSNNDFAATLWNKAVVPYM